MKTTIIARLGMIFSQDDISRITVKDEAEKNLMVTVDVHGMKCSQAKRFINNIINTIRTAFKLIIIHGYNHGTAIKDMLAANFTNSHIVDQYQDSYNKGITYMVLA
jgi:DNA-nicking Smr family endonuclease